MSSAEVKTVKKVSAAVLPAAASEDLPKKGWSAEQLVEYSASAVHRANVMARKTAIEAWLAGQALLFARNKAKHGEWLALLKAHDIPRSTANELIRLAERVRSQRQLENLTVAEAMKISGIRRDKKETARASAADGDEDATGSDELDEETNDFGDDEPEVEHEPRDSDESDPDADEEEDDEEDYEQEEDEQQEEEEDEDDEADEDEPEYESPLKAMSDVVRRLSNVEQLLDAEGLDDEDSDEFLEALDDAENALKRIRKVAAPRPPRAAAKSDAPLVVIEDDQAGAAGLAEGKLVRPLSMGARQIGSVDCSSRSGCFTSKCAEKPMLGKRRKRSQAERTMASWDSVLRNLHYIEDTTFMALQQLEPDYAFHAKFIHAKELMERIRKVLKIPRR